MCHATECDECGKATWEGCGMHIEQALCDVEPADRCKCIPIITAMCQACAAETEQTRLSAIDLYVFITPASPLPPMSDIVRGGGG